MHCKVVSSLNCLFWSIDTKYANNYSSVTHCLSQTLELAWEACHQLDVNTMLMDVMQYVLAIGNFLNAKTNKGGAHGIKLSSLAKVTTG